MAAHPLFPTGRLMPPSEPGGCCHLLTTSRERKTDDHQGSNTPKTLYSNNSSQQRLKNASATNNIKQSSIPSFQGWVGGEYHHTLWSWL